MSNPHLVWFDLPVWGIEGHTRHKRMAPGCRPPGHRLPTSFRPFRERQSPSRRRRATTTIPPSRWTPKTHHSSWRALSTAHDAVTHRIDFFLRLC